ncbi:perilipin 3, partial [Chelydra serpentina]
NVLRKVASLPLVNSAYDLAVTAYASTKESHPYVRSICDMAEKGVTSITNVAVSSSQAVVTKPEPEVTTAAEYASEVPDDKVEEHLPILQQTADKVTSETQELPSSRLSDVKETMIRILSDVKETMIRMVDMTKDAVQDGMKTTKSVVTDGMSTVLEKSEELLDHYLPMTEDELEGAEVSSAQPQERRSYFVRLGSLSTKLRQRAYRYSLNKMRCTSQSIREALSQLHQTMDACQMLVSSIQGLPTNFQEKVQQVYHNIEELHASFSTAHSLQDLSSSLLTQSQEMVTKAQDACQMLVSSIQGLPTNFQEKVQQVYHNIEELHASFSTAHSLQDLSSSLLTQSQEMVTKAQEHVDELMAYVMENTPLSWVVGPFTPAGKVSADSIEPQSQENVAKEAEVLTASKSKEDL